jgi:hypothetical protein
VVVHPLLRGEMTASAIQLPQGINWTSERGRARIRTWDAVGRSMKSMLESRFRVEVAQLIHISEIPGMVKY